MTTLGQRIKAGRALAGGMTQAALGAACSMSRARVSRIECGTEIPTASEREALARVLGMDPAELGVSRATTGVALGLGGESEDDMRRRNLLTAASIGVGAAAVPAGPAAAHKPPAPGWESALTQKAKSTMSTAQVDAGLDQLAQEIGYAHYAEAAASVPRLITAAEANARSGGRRSLEVLARTYVLATAVSVKERHDISWITADRAVQAARRAQHPLAHAMAARAQVGVFRQRGHHRWARQLADQTVAELEGEERARPVVAHLLLETAYGAAQANQGSDALSLWEHARSLAERGPAAAAWADHPGPMTSDQVERYGLCIQHLLGNIRRAIGHMEALDADAVPTAERAARIRHDSAKLYRDLGDFQSALRLLRTQEAITPQDVRRSSVRRMVSDLLATSPVLPGLRPFALHIGAV